MAKVSILMNCYNGEKYVKAALESVYAQTFEDWEVIFVDNCSTDASANIARSFDHRIKYHRTPEFMSLCQARVWARPLIEGEYFAVLDADDLFLPQKLEKQVAILDSCPNVGLVYSNSQFFTDKEDTKIYYDSTMPSGNIFRELLGNYFLSLETLMVRKSVMDSHNIYFDAKYNIASDAEMYTKLAYFTEAYYIDEVLAKWRHGYESESVKQFMSFPREYELILADLKGMIPNFESLYCQEIRKLKSRIANMYGMGHWQAGHFALAKESFATARNLNFKYFIPWLAIHFVTYKTYQRLRKLRVKT